MTYGGGLHERVSLGRAVEWLGASMRIGAMSGTCGATYGMLAKSMSVRADSRNREQAA